MQTFIPGQRWVSDTESELGLGTVTEISGRTVTLLFSASGESRSYAMQTAPLTRVAFTAGEQAKSQHGWLLLVKQTEEQNGLLLYRGIDTDGQPRELPEGELDAGQIFSRPQDRLLRGQLDKPKWFDLRYTTLQQAQRLALSVNYGLTGIRADLLPHQLYIAHEVANRSNPRVLLADEVGLGKTIEAGMIIHHQLLTGRARRVLILVPDPLLHQWLVELLRRFNLSFKIFDEERCQAIEESIGQDNPFITEQLVLSSINLFLNHPQRHAQALNGGWDLLVVDEAHHLDWSEDNASDEYRAVEQIAENTAGVLLLTATPEQLGKSGHFARLRLLDPDRFHSLEAFEQEETHFAPIADAVELLISGQPEQLNTVQQLLTQLHDDNILQLLLQMQQTSDSAAFDKLREQLIHQLIDRHGTGRVLFRNTRARIKGFPERIAHAWPLDLPELYQPDPETDFEAPQLLQPEHLFSMHAKISDPDWSDFDPRIGWLTQLLKQHSGSKMLLICAKADTAMELEQVLRTREGILSAVFHEHLSIIERDRAAAWFADPEEGTQLLICSEIGSEGRNFQFAHHLVLFDLPFNPDLLEQRIGRLDRIGQQHSIHIHVPYFSDSATETMFHWYEQGLNAFARTCPEGHSVFQQLEPALAQALADPDPEQIQSLLNSAQQLAQQTREELERGRDHLLELSSCRQPQANQLVEQIRAEEQPGELSRYLDKLADCYGLDLEEHSAHSQILRPTAQMSVDAFPALPQDGMTLTTDRNTALLHEDRHFISWEHPLVRGAMDLALSGIQGRTGLIAAKLPGGQSGLLLECLFVLEAIGPAGLQAGRFLPPTCLRMLVNSKGENLAEQIDYDELADNAIALEKKTLMNLLNKALPAAPALLQQAEAQVKELAEPILQKATEQMLDYYTSEIQRLTQLQTINPLVRDDEIEDLQAEGLALHRILENAQLRLDAIRLVVLA
ncbi:MAG: RNA polymerase-associated protein RapA [Chromatiales bacterium]|jgi:ATP-dependent helicase HepA